jgi:hypothetical protein
VLRPLRFDHAVSQRLPADDEDVFAAARSPFASATSFLSASASPASSSRLVIVAPGSTISGIACFVQTTAPSASDTNAAANAERRTLVLVVPSFNLRPNSAEYTEFFAVAAQCLSSVGPRDAVVIDVQSNGGGLVLAGYALLAMVFPQFAPTAASASGAAPVVSAAMHYRYDEPQGAAIAAIKARDTKVR